MKIALAQLNYHIGNFSQNVSKMKMALETAKGNGVDLIVFAELAVCGYPPRDLLEFSDFNQRCQEAISDLAESCHGISAIVGGPVVNPQVEGKDLFNAAFLLENGSVRSIIHKALLPNYDVFDEYRYFEPGRDLRCVEVSGTKIALTICEDLWNVVDPMYRFNPMDELIEEQPALMINIAASPFHSHQQEKRTEVLSANCKKYGLPLLYLNHVGAQTELIFDGSSLAMNEQGEKIGSLASFNEDIAYFNFDGTELMAEDSVKPEQENKTARVHDALVLGIQDYFEKLGFDQAVLGLSGGIDSAVTLALAVRALGPDNVHSILMPSMYSSDHSVNDSEELCRNLGSSYEMIPISSLFNQFEEDLAGTFRGKPADLAEENLQARIRGVLLMAYSNKHGAILLNTSNKSEAAVGYGTLYGDMNGGLSVIGDVYKTEVYQLAEYINRNKEIIPFNITEKPPSAELRPDQKDSDSLPEYDKLDRILNMYIEERLGPEEIIKEGNDRALVNRVLRLVNLNEYKRHQTPPILRVSSKAFGMGRRMPIVGKYLI